LGIAILGLVVPLCMYALIYWTLFAVSKAIPGTRLPLGPLHPVPLSHASDYDSANLKSARQADPGSGLPAGQVDHSIIDENRN
jgi:hypothetical protein